MVGLELPTVTPCVVMESNEEFSNQVPGSPVDESVSPSASAQLPRDVTCLTESPKGSSSQEVGTSVAESPFCSGPSQLPSVVTASVSPPEHEGELNYNIISKHLIQYIPVKKTHTTGKRATDTRVLTSSECAAEIFEREERKRKKRKNKKLGKPVRN